MLPTQIKQHSVDLVLQYISPPNDLHPLPPYLISKSLLQRHHFLEIPPDNHRDYLCWPSNVQSEVIDILESRSTDESPSLYQYRYSFDGDFCYAHVDITPDRDNGLRVIFQWDDPDEVWKFHDLNLMPFPPGATDSPHTVSDFIADDKTIDQTPPLIISSDSSTTENDDDAYWDAYGADDGLSSAAHNFALDKESNTEDAYWAQYSSVHGSADSTVPSPLPTNRRQPIYPVEDANPNDPNAPGNNMVIIPTSTFHPGRQPSPSVLAHLLTSLSPREPTFTSPILGTSSKHSPVDEDTSNIIAMRRRSHEGGIHRLRQPRPMSLTGLTTFIQNSNNSPLVSQADDGEITLKEVIRGVYRLWKMQGNHEDDKERFLRTVHEAIE